MKKNTLFFIAFIALSISAFAQYSFPPVTGPTNVSAGAPVTLSINDAGNTAAVPASSSGSYSSFSVSADWIAGGGNPYSSEADLTLTTTAGSILINPPTSGGLSSGSATTLIFEGDFSGLYDPTTDGFLDIVINQSWSGSDADWSNIVVTIFESPTCPEPLGMMTSNLTTTTVDLAWTAGNTETAWNLEWKADTDFTPGNSEQDGADSASGTAVYYAIGLSAFTTYYVYYQADCSGDTSTWVGPFSFYTGYCESMPSSNDGQGIGSIILGSTTFNSAGDVTYEDFTGTTVDLSESILANLQITFLTGYTYGTNVWIDFNNDLVFDNTTELVFSGTSLSDNPTTLDASFMMPSVPYGTYRMRIGTADFGQATPNPCYTGAWGVTADLTINVTAPPACIPPNGIMAANSGADTIVFSWTAGDVETDWNIEINAGADFTPGNSEEDIADTVSGTPSYTASGLMTDTTYYVYYQADCGGNTSTWVGPFSYYNGYCDSVPSSNDGDGITQVVLGSTTFVSAGDVTYEDFTGTTVDLSELVTANLQITFGHTYTYGTNVWIDFNNDLVFDNATELVFQGNSSGGANPHTLDASFVMPATPLGVYNMRIGSADFGQATPDPCYDGSWGVTADLIINITAPPACIPPSFLIVSSIGGTTADISWTANSGETSWEYVVQPVGTGEPSGSGILSSTSTFTETGLNYSTNYEIYARANCDTDGYSTWSGPVNFTTTIQTYYDIVCDTDSPININYCYDNNDTTSWTFNSDNGFPLELTFNAGTIEGFWDDITIYDGSDNTAPVLFNNNANDQDDLAGLVIETTGTSMYIEIDSDGSGSCQSSSFYTPWDFDIVCKTCLTQSATYTIVGDCDTTQEFTIDVEITDMGTATSLTVSDGTSNQTAMATGIVTFGPYPTETPIIITVTNADDSSCEIMSKTLNLICPPPPNPCSIVYAGEDTSTCEGTSTNLTASYQVLGQDTNSYEINALDSCPQPPASGGEPSFVEIDDRWSDVIDLGFEFCFFGGTYNQIVIGANGVLTFDLANAGGFNNWNIDAGDTLPNSSNSSLSQANIFGVAHDIDPSVCGNINYYILGASPSRQFVVNYTDVCHFGSSCNALTSSSQIILYESSNAIDINIFDKPACEDWNEGNAVVGVQNPEGTIAFTPPGRNTGVWEATNEYWRFTPSLGAPNFTIEWFEGDTQIGGSDTVTVSPTETTTYTAAITYALCTGGTATITDDVVVEILENPEPVAVQDTIVICEGIGVTLEVVVENSDIPETITYYWTYDGVDIQVGPENSYSIPEGTSQFGDFIVTAIDGNGCYGDTIITVIAGAYPVVSPVEPLITKCINEEAILEVLVSNTSELSDSVTYNWYIGGSIAQSSSDSTYLHGIGDAEAVVTIEVVDDVSQCSTETEITVTYYENEYCVDIPQGLSPNNDGYNDCLILDHLEDRHDISKAIVFNRYGTKVFELNNYVDQWCGTNQDGEVLPVGTYFYIIYFNTPREPITSWIYLNY
jgi:gliding motility-associated-like protein